MVMENDTERNNNTVYERKNLLDKKLGKVKENGYFNDNQSLTSRGSRRFNFYTHQDYEEKDSQKLEGNLEKEIKKERYKENSKENSKEHQGGNKENSKDSGRDKVKESKRNHTELTKRNSDLNN